MNYIPFAVSSKLDFHTITILSLPPLQKKSPPEEKLQAVVAPSCPYKV